jgi:hypothetical protein
LKPLKEERVYLFIIRTTITFAAHHYLIKPYSS